MAISSIPQVKINGSSKAYGGYIFNVNYVVGLNKVPSEITISFISESGSYQRPTLSSTVPVKISIGNLVDDTFYPISLSDKRSGGSKTLDVTFRDSSLILDKLFIGLHKQHGINKRAVSRKSATSLDNYVSSIYPDPILHVSEKGSNLIIVGEEVHPCDMNDDLVFDAADLELLAYDASDPCQLKCNHHYADYNSIHAECVTKTRTSILEVNYNLEELLAAISQYVSVAQEPSDVHTKYRAKYTGTLRSVLTSWCSDLGLSFFWEKGQLHFVDVSKRVKITIPELPCFKEFEFNSTLEGTICRGTITNYSKQGEIISTNCNSPQPVALSCLTLRDLYRDVWVPSDPFGDTGTPHQKNKSSSAAVGTSSYKYKDTKYPLGVPVEKLEEAVICSFYDQRLRWLYILRNYYGLNQVSDWRASINGTADRFGQMKILGVCDSSDTTAYSALTADGTAFDVKRGELKSFQDNQGFFVIAELNQDLLEEQYAFEAGLGASFIGQHWVRSYIGPNSGTAPEIKPNGQYLGGATAELKQAGFTSFRHSNNSKVANLARQLQEQPELLDNKSPLKNRNFIHKNTRSVIYYDRGSNARWMPRRDDKQNEFQKVLDNMASQMPAVINVQEAAITNVLASLQISNAKNAKDLQQKIKDKKVVILAMYPGYFTMTASKVTNPEEESPMHVPIGESSVSQLGLMSKTSYKYLVWGMPVIMPAASSCRFNKDYDDPLLTTSTNFQLKVRTQVDMSKPSLITAPHYLVAVNQTYTPYFELPKIQAVFSSSPAVGDALAVEYAVYPQGSKKEMALLANMKDECVPDTSSLQAYHDDFNAKLVESVTEPFDSYTFSIDGVTLDSAVTPSISNGLERVNISVSERGVSSSFTFGNSLFTPIRLDTKRQEVEYALAASRRSELFGKYAMPSQSV
jgi:hypothetical protein